MCEQCQDLTERIRKEKGLPKDAMIPLGYVCPKPRYKIE